MVSCLVAEFFSTVAPHFSLSQSAMWFPNDAWSNPWSNPWSTFQTPWYWAWGACQRSVDTDLWSEIETKWLDYELSAQNALNNCISLAESGSWSNGAPIMHDAMKRLRQGDPTNAMLALNSTTRGRVSCRDLALRDALGSAMKAISDVVVWRVQIRVPWGNDKCFMAELEQAAGGTIDVDAKARFMHSHRKAVQEHFASAFLSNSKKESVMSKAYKRT